MFFRLVAEDSGARLGLIETAHGVIETPVFMPVGTCGSVKAMTQDMLEEVGAEIILGNTYHLYLRPGHELIREMGGLHEFMSWRRPILTDSGGFQVYSLAQISRRTEEGVTFKSHIDGTFHLLTPERSIQIQVALGSDIIMAFDECTPYPASKEQVIDSLELTTRWARRSADEFKRLAEQDLALSKRAVLFGIVQGGIWQETRLRSVEQLLEIGFAGYAIGGLSVGEAKQYTYDIAEYTASCLPAHKPRYLMGVGTPEDLVECVARGVDMFDCVMPTRNARNGQVFTSSGKLNIKNAEFARDVRPLDPSCGCRVCRRYSRSYIRHLYKSAEILASILCTYHNIYFYLDTMKKIRHSIRCGLFRDFRRSFLSALSG